MHDYELYHHGVLGMKWGIRKDRSSGGGSARGVKRKKKANNLNKSLKKENDSLKKELAAAKKKYKTAREMSDTELRNVVNRLQLERQYKAYMKELYPEKKTFVERFAEKAIKDVVIPASVEVGKNLLKDAMTNAVKSANKDKK